MQITNNTNGPKSVNTTVGSVTVGPGQTITANVYGREKKSIDASASFTVAGPYTNDPSDDVTLKRWDRNGITFLGNSRLESLYRNAANADILDNTRRYSAHWMTQAFRYLGARLRDKGVFARSGSGASKFLSTTPGPVPGTDYAMLAYLRGFTNNVDAAFATDAYWLWIDGPVNDISQAETALAGSGYDVDYWITYYRPIVDKWIAQGRMVVLTTEVGSEGLSGKPAAIDALDRYNTQVRAFCRENGGAILFDVQQIVADQTAASTITFKSGFSGETSTQRTHFNLNEGAVKLGKAFADLMSPLVSPIQMLANAQTSARSDTNKNANLFRNPLFLTTSAGAIGADHSGTRPSGITGFAPRNPSGASTAGRYTVVSSILPGAYGNDWKIQITNSVGDGWVEFIADIGITNAENPGDVIYANCEIDYNASFNLQGVELHIEHGRAGTQYVVSDGFIDNQSSGSLTTLPKNHVIQTPEMLIRPGARSGNLIVRLRLYVSGSTTSTSEILVRRLGVWSKPTF